MRDGDEEAASWTVGAVLEAVLLAGGDAAQGLLEGVGALVLLRKVLLVCVLVESEEGDGEEDEAATKGGTSRATAAATSVDSKVGAR